MAQRSRSWREGVLSYSWVFVVRGICLYPVMLCRPTDAAAGLGIIAQDHFHQVVMSSFNVSLQSVTRQDVLMTFHADLPKGWLMQTLKLFICYRRS